MNLPRRAHGTRRAARATLTLCVAITAASPLLAEDWPGWLGPRRDLTTSDTGWSVDWPEAGPEILWRAEVGIGFASMSVVDGRLYTMGHRDGREIVHCLDAKSGERLWAHEYPAKLLDNLHEGGPAATPTVAGDRVYTLGKEGLLHALDRKSGAIAWRRDVRELFGVKVPEWGFSSSPRVEGDRLYLDVGRLVALRLSDGEPVWRTKPYKCGYGTPTLFEHGGRRLVAVLNNEGLLVADAADGAEVAFHSWPTRYDTNATTPVWLDGRFFVSTGYDKGCVLLRFDGKTLRPEWEGRQMRNHMNNSVVIDGLIYGFDGNAHARRTVHLACLDARTGETRWRQMGYGCGSLIAAGERLVILGDQGDLAVVAADGEGFRELAKAKVLSGKCWTPPALAAGRLYCRNAAGDLVCVRLPGA